MLPVFCCDNLGVVHHGNNPRRPLPAKQAQGDVLRVFKRLMIELEGAGMMRHVYGHLDDILRNDQLTLQEKMNCLADKLASAALMEAITNGQYISSCFPFEDLRLLVNGVKVTGAANRAISNFWGSKVARQLFHDRRMINTYDFNLVY